MKKIFIALVLACVCVLPAVSQSKGSETQSSKPIWDHGDNVASFTYRNVRVYKVYDYKTAYVVLYEKVLRLQHHSKIVVAPFCRETVLPRLTSR